MHLFKKIIAVSSYILVLVIFGWVGVPQSATAVRADPWLQENSAIARLALDEEFHPLAGVTYYDLHINGVRIGKLTIEVIKKGEDFILQAAARIRSVISSLYTVRYQGHAVVSSNPVQPSEAVIEEQKGKKTKIFLLKFPEPDHVSAVQIEHKAGKESTQTHKEFSSESFVLDPFSTFFLIRSLKWRVGDEQVFDILTGKKQYELKLTCRGETVLEVDGKPREVWEIVLQTRSHEPPRKIKLSGFVLYLSKDSGREIIKITGKHKIGRIVAHMRTSDGQEG